MVAEPASGDQADLGVDLLDRGVGQLVGDRRFDPFTLLGDPAGELDERLQLTASGPFQPGLEQDQRVLGGDAVDLAQLLGEEVGAVQLVVELLDARELELLAFGQVLGVFPEREPRALELAGELGLALTAGVVPDLAADLVQRVGGGLDDMERVQADDRVRAPLGDRPGDSLGVVTRHELDLLTALVAEQIQELLDRLAISAGVRPTSLPVS